MTELTLQIDGMSCDHCVRRVTKALEGALGGAETVTGRVEGGSPGAAASGTALTGTAAVGTGLAGTAAAGTGLAGTGLVGAGLVGPGPVGSIKQVRVGSATVNYDGRPESLDAIIQALDRAGYSARPASETVRS